MAFLKKDRKQDNCPKCFLMNNINTPLNYQPGSKFSHFCNNGHEFPDREELSVLMKQMNDKIRGPVQENKVVVGNEIPDVSDDQTVINAVKTDEITGEKLASPPPAPISDQKGIVIGAVDFSRISSIVGHFTDSSSLFGAIFALQQELGDAKELLKRANDAKQISSVRKVGGDAVIQAIIPERHVIPLTDVAEANGMDLTRYINARLEDACDNQWFY